MKIQNLVISKKFIAFLILGRITASHMILAVNDYVDSNINDHQAQPLQKQVRIMLQKEINELKQTDLEEETMSTEISRIKL